MLITILLPDLRAGGAERISIDLAHEFSRQGHLVEFALMDASGEFLKEATSAFTVVDLRTPRSRNLPRTLTRYIRARRPDMIIANMWPLTVAAVVGRFLSRTRTRLLLVDHCMLSDQYRSWGRLQHLAMRISMGFFYRGADAVGAVSRGVAKDVARLALLRPDKVSVLGNPMRRLPTGSQAHLSYADSLWACPVGARVLTVGSLKSQKNHSLMLRAFAQLRLPNARLMIVGGGEDEGLLRRLSEQLGISDRVIFAGFQADPSPFYLTSDLFVLSSDYEGLPTVLLEALSCGLRVVSTDCPSGPSEILDNGRLGKLVPAGDETALANAMKDALAEPADTRALKRRAEDFAPEIAARRYLELMELT